MEKKYRLKLLIIFTAFFALTLPATVFGQSTFTMDPDPASDCGGLIVTFTNSNACSPLTTETWRFDDGINPEEVITRTTQLGQPFQKIFTPGTYQVTLEEDCITKSLPQTVTVSTSPEAIINPFTLVGNCVPQFVSLNGGNSTPGSAGTSIVDYLWTIENIETGTRSASFDEVFNFTFSDPGRYRISLRVTDDSGCENLGFYDEIITLGEGFNAGFLPDTRQVSCAAPFDVNFQYILDPGNYTVNWDFGDGNTFSTTLDDTQDPTTIPVTHTYDALGSYDVTMQVTNGAGCTIVDTKPALVEIMDFVPGFIANNAAGCSPFTATFTPDFPQGDQTLTWTFGDGNTLTGLASDPDIYSPEHLYENVGFYDVTLSVTGDPNGCDGSITENDFIEVFPNAVADFSINNASTFCDPTNANVEFVNLSSSETETVIWDFGDGSPLLTVNRGDPNFDQVNNDYSGQDSTSYTVSLTAISANGCESSVEFVNLVQVQSTVIDFSANSVNGCSGDFIFTLFDNTSSAVISTNYIWEIRDSSNGLLVASDSGAQLSTYSDDLDRIGTYDVILTIENSCGRSSLEKTNFIQVGRAPASVDFTPSATQVCNQTEVTFTNDYQGDTTGVTFGWDFLGVDSVFSTEFDGTYTYDNQDPGTVTVALYVNSNGCLDTVYKDIEILAPKAALEFHTDKCALDTIYLVDRSVGATDGVEWTVSVGGTNIPVVGSPKQVPIFVPPGTDWEATIRAFDNATSCIDEFTIGGTQPNFGMPNFDALTAIKGNNCFPTAVRFNDTGELEVPGSAITNYRWDFGNGEISNDPSPQIIYTEPGYYSVSLSITTDLGCTFDTTYSDFVQITGPQINFEVCDAGTCKDNEVSFRDLTTSINPIASWEWDFGDGGTSTDQNPSYTYTDINNPQDRFYWVKLTVTDDQGCSALDSVKVRPTKPEGDFVIQQDPACGGEMISFLHMDSLSVGLRPLNAQWEFDNGTSAQGLEPTLFFEGSMDGITYEVTTLIFDLNSCLDTVVRSFTVYKDEINPEFTASPLNGACPPLDVTFEKMLPALVGPNAGPGRDNSIYAYIWDFGDGIVLADSAATGPQDIITYTYRNPGTYTPTLTVIDATGCDSTYTLPDQIVVGGPEGTFTASDTIGYPDLVVETQVDDPVDGFTYIWDFGEGTLTTGIDTVNTYTTPGSYTLAMQIDDGNCQFTADEKQILVLPCPVLEPMAFDWCTSQGDVTINVFDPTHDLQLGTIHYEWFDPLGNLITASNDVDSLVIPPPANLMANETQTYQVRVYVDDLTHGSALNENIKCDKTVDIAITFLPSPIADFTYLPECNLIDNPPYNVIFEYEIPPGDITDQVFWDFNNDSIYDDILNNFNPTTTFDSAGIFPVGLIVESLNGCQDTIRKNIYIPRADFTFENACAGQPVIFTDSSAYDPAIPGTEFTWDFGDGNTTGPSEVDSVVTNIFAAGDYDVQLTVETFLPDGVTACVVTITKTITISPLPEPFLQVEPACSDQPTVLTGNDDPLITEWQWDFDNDGTVDTTTTTNTVTHDYPTVGGPFESALTIVTGNGCSATEVFGPIIVTISPEAAYQYNNACVEESILFENTSTIASGNIVRSEWYFTGDPIPDFVFDDTRDVSYIYQTPGVYDVMLKVFSDGFCEDSVVQTVVVSDNPRAAFISPDSVCGGQPVTFLDQSTSVSSAIISYLWDFDSDGLIDAEGNNPSYTFPVTGQSFDVTLNVITLAGCSGSITQPVFVKDPPIIETSDDEYICEGDEVTLSVINPLPDGVYVWDNNGGVGPEVTVMPTISTLYTVTYTDSLGCTAESFVNISVVSFPESLPNDTIVCDVDQFVLDATIPGGLPATYTWSPGGETDPTIIVDESGVYTVTATVAGFDGTARECTITRDITVEFNPEPDLVPAITDACFQNDEVVTLEVPSTYTTVVWTSPDLPNPVFSRSITVVQEGIYYVTASNETCIVTDSVEVQELCEPRLFVPTAFTPNGDGTNDVFNVKGKNFARYELTIFNRWGEVIFTTGDKDEGWKGYYLGELMPAGVYAWMVKYESEITPGDPIVKYGSVTLVR